MGAQAGARAALRHTATLREKSLLAQSELPLNMTRRLNPVKYLLHIVDQPAAQGDNCCFLRSHFLESLEHKFFEFSNFADWLMCCLQDSSNWVR